MRSVETGSPPIGAEFNGVAVVASGLLPECRVLDSPADFAIVLDNHEVVDRMIMQSLLKRALDEMSNH
jgi:hypothetical protein